MRPLRWSHVQTILSIHRPRELFHRETIVIDSSIGILQSPLPVRLLL